MRNRFNNENTGFGNVENMKMSKAQVFSSPHLVPVGAQYENICPCPIESLLISFLLPGQNLQNEIDA